MNILFPIDTYLKQLAGVAKKSCIPNAKSIITTPTINHFFLLYINIYT